MAEIIDSSDDQIRTINAFYSQWRSGDLNAINVYVDWLQENPEVMNIELDLGAPGVLMVTTYNLFNSGDPWDMRLGPLLVTFNQEGVRDSEGVNGLRYALDSCPDIQYWNNFIDKGSFYVVYKDSPFMGNLSPALNLSFYDILEVSWDYLMIIHRRRSPLLAYTDVFNQVWGFTRPDTHFGDVWFFEGPEGRGVVLDGLFSDPFFADSFESDGERFVLDRELGWTPE